jgi:hypothetical protein
MTHQDQGMLSVTKQKVLMAGVVSLIAACSLEPKRIDLPTTTRIIVQPATPSETDQLLAYAGKIRKLDAREFGLEREQVRAAFQRDKTDVSRVRYALLLASAGSATSAIDDVELTTVIEPLAGTPPNSINGDTGSEELRTLAQVLHGMTLERRKLREQLRESQARLNLAKRDEVREGESRALRAKVDELEKKLSALKSIDRSVNRRLEAPTK